MENETSASDENNEITKKRENKIHTEGPGI